MIELTIHQRLIKYSIYRALLRISLAILLKVLHPVDTIVDCIMWFDETIKAVGTGVRSYIIDNLKSATEDAEAFEIGTKEIPKVPKHIVDKFWHRLIFEKFTSRKTETGTAEMCDTMDDYEFGVSLDKETYKEINDQLLKRSEEANKNFEIPGQRINPPTE